MYRAVFVRGLPSIDHFLFTPKKYLPRRLSASSFEICGPVYSIMRLPLGIILVAKSPSPVRVRLTAKSVFDRCIHPA